MDYEITYRGYRDSTKAEKKPLYKKIQDATRVYQEQTGLPALRVLVNATQLEEDPVGREDIVISGHRFILRNEVYVSGQPT